MTSDCTGKIVIFSAPSGSGKTTVVNHLVKEFPQLEFSISATSRTPRGDERNGHEYYFFSDGEFKEMADRGEFIEWEEVYAGTSYGTLKSEVERIWAKGNIIVFDVDAKGGISLKEIFGDCALSVFVMPPSVDELRRRLLKRGTDSDETIERRLAKAAQEIGHAPSFDMILVNDHLPYALAEAERIIGDFIAR